MLDFPRALPARRRRGLRLAAGVGLALIVMSAPTGPRPTAAQAGRDGAEPVAAYVGRYELARSFDESLARVKRAVDKAVAGVAFPIRGYVRSELLKNNQPPELVVVARDGDMVRTTYGDSDGYRITYASPPDGTFVDAESPHGDPIRVGHRVHDGRLQALFMDDRARLLYSFRRQGDDRLTLQATVVASVLPDPMSYALAYRRVTRSAHRRAPSSAVERPRRLRPRQGDGGDAPVD